MSTKMSKNSQIIEEWDRVRRCIKVDGRSFNSARMPLSARYDVQGGMERNVYKEKSKELSRLSAFELGCQSARDFSLHQKSGERARTMACALNAYRHYMRDEFNDNTNSKQDIWVPSHPQPPQKQHTRNHTWTPQLSLPKNPTKRARSAGRNNVNKSPVNQDTPRTACIANFVLLDRKKLLHDQNPLVKRIREMESRKTNRRRRQQCQQDSHEVGQVQGRGHCDLAHDNTESRDTPTLESYRSDSGCFSRVNTPYTESYIIHPEWISEVQRRAKSCDRERLSMSLNVSRCPLRDRSSGKFERRHFKASQNGQVRSGCDLNIYDLAIVAPPPSAVGSAGYVSQTRRCRSAPAPRYRSPRSRNPVTWNPPN